MFGVSFSELGLIFVVALVVIGPARLPGLVRKIGRWVGKARSMARDFQQQLESEINLEELNRLTDIRTKEAQSRPKPAATTTAADPAAAAQEPAETTAAGNPSAAQDQLASSGYPYGVQASDPDAPKPGDDTYSHAHAEGAAPVVDEPVEEAAAQKKEDGAAGAA
jgi:sec-independent protein translocase protein TatB